MDVDNENREKELIQKVKTANRQFLKATGNSTRAFIELGQHLNDLKEERKTRKTKQSWTKYIEEEMPWLNKRRAQRAMKAAKAIDIESCPGLATLSQRKISALASIAKDKPVVEMLSENNIDCDFSLKDQKEVKDFEGDIDNLVNKLREEKKGQKKPLYILKRLPKSVESLQRNFSEIADNQDLRDQLKEINLNEIEVQLSSLLLKIREVIQASE
jgi:hypothetical protein